MASIKYEDLLSDVLPYLAAAPADPVSENAIKRAVIEFCSESWIWQQPLDAIDIEAGVNAYDITPPNTADLTVLMSAAAQGKPLDNKTATWLDANLPGWNSADCPGVPRFYTQYDTATITLAPVPDESAAGGLVVTAALQPSQAATSFPKWIGDKYRYELCDGALAKLMLMPGKPWTDLQNGPYREARFRSAIVGARTAAVAALSRAPLRSKGQH